MARNRSPVDTEAPADPIRGTAGGVGGLPAVKLVNATPETPKSPRGLTNPAPAATAPTPRLGPRTLMPAASPALLLALLLAGVTRTAARSAPGAPSAPMLGIGGAAPATPGTPNEWSTATSPRLGALVFLGESASVRGAAVVSGSKGAGAGAGAECAARASCSPPPPL